MKYLKNIDLTGQSILFVLTLGLSLTVSIGTRSLESIAYFGLIGQFFIGCWQMASSFILLILKAEHFKLRSIHFSLALGCLMLIAITAALKNAMDNWISESLMILTGVVIPWCLALFYYSITWRWMFPKHQGKFLSHINF